MAEDLFAYQLNHPLQPEQQPYYSIRPPSSSRKGKQTQKRHGRNKNSYSESKNDDYTENASNNNNSTINDKQSNDNTNNELDDILRDLDDALNDNKKSRTRNSNKNTKKIREKNNDTSNDMNKEEIKSESLSQSINNGNSSENNNESNNNNNNNNEEEEEPKDDLQRYKEIAVSGGDFSDIPTELLSPLMRSLYEVRASYLSQGLVNEAEVVDNSIHICRELMTDQAKIDAMNSRQQEINERLINAQNELAELEDTIERQERNMRLQLQKQVISLEAKHQEEIDKLTRDWESPEKARRYNRSSAQLRQLRAQSVKLLNAHRYDEMKVVERMADKLQADEVAAQQQQWENDFNTVLRKLLGRHQIEREKLKMAHNVQIGEYEAAKRFDLSVIQKRIQNLERELAESSDSERVWNLYHRNDIVVKTNNSSGAGKRKVKPSEFSQLALPPLTDSKTNKLPPAAALAAKTFRYSPRTPRLTQ
ncbi:hypothetical protein M9Y10_041521 [Tritrichomonas musculus]|uniref:DUF4201 domain-containing protein n=1 Tax=Tritrichomonas musculus TaxID=1915356 RepID=A0ABR2K4L5_9EUKA